MRREISWVMVAIGLALAMTSFQQLASGLSLGQASLPGASTIAFFEERGCYVAAFGVFAICYIEALFRNSHLPLIAGFFGVGAVIQSPGLAKCVAAATGILLELF
jgi:hypothetical protein